MGRLVELTSLDLSGCVLLTDAGARSLRPLRRLTSLHLISCAALTDDALRALTQLSELTTLHLYGCGGATDEGVRAVSARTPHTLPRRPRRRCLKQRRSE